MKLQITNYNIAITVIQLLNDSDEIVAKGILIEGNGLCTSYYVEEESFNFVCISRFKLDTMLVTQYLRIKVWKEYELQLSSRAEI